MTNNNTAILIDLENLVCGYNNADLAHHLSLKDIYNTIRSKIEGGISIQRAYANWSVPILNILKGEIIQLGIEPVQVFGFGKGYAKNAADIQLIIDAFEIAVTRTHIEQFVIVSGDGGFSYIANKLRQYGKRVVGCAYERNTSHIFKSVCDDFIWIEYPLIDEENTSTTGQTDLITTPGGSACTDQAVQTVESIQINHPLVRQFAAVYPPVIIDKPEAIITEARKILRYLANDSTARKRLKNEGLNISVYSQMLKYRIQDFDYKKLGFPRFTDFMRFVTYQSGCRLFHMPPSEFRLLVNGDSLNGFTEVEYISDYESYVHSVDNYARILATGMPSIKLFRRDDLFNVAEYMVTQIIDFTQKNVSVMIDQLSDALGIQQTDVKNILLAMVSASCFVREPEGARLAEQNLSLPYRSSEEIIARVEDTMREKILQYIDRIDEKVFEQLWS